MADVALWCASPPRLPMGAVCTLSAMTHLPLVVNRCLHPPPNPQGLLGSAHSWVVGSNAEVALFLVLGLVALAYLGLC